MDRRKYEPIETTITRLKRSLYKLDMANNQKENISIDPSNESSAPRASFESCALDSTIPGTSLSTNGTNSNDPRQKNTATTPDCYSISFLSSSFECFDQKSSLLEVAQNASFLSLNDTLLQIFNNVSRICDVFLSSRAMVGCPLTVQIQSDGSLNYDDVVIDWWDDRGQLLHRGPVYIPPEFMAYRVVKAIVTHNRLPWNFMESDFCRVFDAPINRWQYERIMLFNTSPVGNATSPLQSDSMDLRVMSFNILSPTYVATDEAIQRFFPYCPHEWLDSSYRNPLILREIFLLRPHILCLQECATSAYRNYIEPVLGQQYYSWLTIKNTTSDEGCCIFIKKDIFDVVDVQSLMFKEQILRPEYSDLLNRIGAPNWLNYDEKTYFSKFHTVFQLGCFVNRSNEKSNYLFLANSHLYFHPSGKHIRLLQTYVLLYELERFKKRCGDKFGFDIETESVTIICGDFNSFSSEGAYHLVVNGWIPYHHEDFEYGLRYSHERFIPSAQNKQYLDSRMNGTPYSFGEQSERLEVPNYQGYHDAYSGHELPFTNFVKTFSGTLDYIFHSNNIKVKRCLPGITTRDAQEYEGLPSKLYPSDHISIAADF
uniref:Endonuclease/exonuclease/phosphatase family protein n=2 Tax=Babesia bovis TaxID=5865 RepID=A7AU11_BABBO|eukprot:XP_001609990.1 endonuclease/exonuclease/phosphatase family protein [Babesia bovis T2Bo]